MVDRSWRQLPRRAAGVVGLLRGELLRCALLRGELLLEQLIPVLQMLRLLARDGRRGAGGCSCLPDFESLKSCRRCGFACEREVVPLLVRGTEVIGVEQHDKVVVRVRDAVGSAPLLVQVLHRHGLRHSLVPKPREIARL